MHLNVMESTAIELINKLGLDSFAVDDGETLIQEVIERPYILSEANFIYFILQSPIPNICWLFHNRKQPLKNRWAYAHAHAIHVTFGMEISRE